MKQLEFIVGKKYKTRGGWEAIVIWNSINSIPKNYYVIHKPGTDDESHPISHDCFGKAYSSLSVSEPPSYDLHPADLMEKDK